MYLACPSGQRHISVTLESINFEARQSFLVSNLSVHGDIKLPPLFLQSPAHVRLKYFAVPEHPNQFDLI